MYHGKRHPRDMGAPEVEAFLTHLAVDGQVAAATQKQALPVVLTREEVQAVLTRMTGTCGLVARLLYGTGMRLMECVRLRVGVGADQTRYAAHAAPLLRDPSAGGWP